MRYDVPTMIERFAAQWGDPKTPNDEMFLGEYERALSGTDPDILREATDTVIDSETYWPRVAIVKRHVEAAAVRRDTSRRYKNPEHQPFDDAPHNPEMKARVAALLSKATEVLRGMGDPIKGPTEPLPDVTKPAFEDMQRNSPNPHLHRRRDA